MLWANLFKRSFSFGSAIFCDTETLLEKGTKTKNLPAIDSSELIRGPLVEIGSFTICTNVFCPVLRTSLMLPSLCISFSKPKFFKVYSL